MIKLLFVCFGNICRSPMAEFYMKDLVEKERISDLFYISSAATSYEEIGNSVYPPARKTLLKHGIDPTGKHSIKFNKKDYAEYDIILVMDSGNYRNSLNICGGDPENKIHMLLDFAGREGEEIDDPWYHRDFERTYREVGEGCRGLLEYLRSEGRC